METKADRRFPRCPMCPLARAEWLQRNHSYLRWVWLRRDQTRRACGVLGPDSVHSALPGVPARAGRVVAAQPLLPEVGLAAPRPDTTHQRRLGSGLGPFRTA